MKIDITSPYALLVQFYQHVYSEWPAVLAWALAILAVVHTALLFSITNPIAPSTLPIRLIPALSGFGGVLILIATARLHQGKPRFACLCFAVALFCSASVEVIQALARVHGAPVVTPLTETLFVIAYLCGFIATALYFPWRLAWLGSAVRVLLEGMAVGCAVFVLAYSWLRGLQVPGPWTPHINSYLAVDIGILFSLSVVVLRYGREGGPWMILVALGTACLFLGDIVFTLIGLVPNGDNWRLLASPFYSLHAVLVALGFYRSVKHPPTIRELRVRQSLGEWFLWAFIPRVLVLVAFVVVALGVVVPRQALMLLFLFGLVCEGVAALDQRRAVSELHIAHAQEQQGRHLMRYFQHELLGNVKALTGLMPMLRASMQTEVSPGDSAKTLQVIDTTIEQLDDLVKELLIISRGGLLASHPPAPVATRALITHMQMAMAYRPDVALNIDHPDEEVFVHGNELYLSLALKTAIRNALEAIDQVSSQPARISITIAVTDQRVFVYIEDSGPGFRPDVLERLEHLRTDKQHLKLGWSTKTEGHGLGIALIDRIVTLHAGTWGCGNLPGGGAWIEICLPRWYPTTTPTYLSGLALYPDR